MCFVGPGDCVVGLIENQIQIGKMLKHASDGSEYTTSLTFIAFLIVFTVQAY